jgi:acyl-CoA synthetase (AMP-forming)/AMP-acid ligase II
MGVLNIAHVDGPAVERVDDLVWIADIPPVGARHCPERPAIVFPDRGETMTYEQLDRRSDAFVAVLQARGLQPGDRVAYLGRNSDLYLPVLFGAIRGNFVLVPLNWRLAPPEIGYQLRDSQSKLLILDPDFVEAGSEAVRDIGDSAPPMLLTEAVGDTGGLRAQLKQPAPPLVSPHEADQVILQLYTSGTTGQPKGVLISHRALSLARHVELMSADLAHLTPGCVILSAMPNFHIGGMSWLLMGLVRLGTVVLTADPSPGNLLRLVREHRATYTFMVPTVLRAIVDELRTREEPAPRMSGIFYGAMPIGEQLLKDLLEVFECPLVQFFGMTENTGSATLLGPRDHDPQRPQLLRSVGKPYPGMSLQIRGPDGRVLRPGEHGEIWIHSPTRLLGYWQLPDKTREALVDGWYASGDGGYIDPAGFLYITDRIKDMIITGGENVYPAEVEEVLRQHPAVLDAAVVGRPDARWGEMVVAYVERRPKAELTAEELLEFARTRVARYKCPKQVHFVDALPRTASGKVQRAKLRQSTAG